MSAFPRHEAARCPGCGRAHPAGTTCVQGREAAWAIIRDRDVRKEFPKLYRWARGYLGLDGDIEAPS